MMMDGQIDALARVYAQSLLNLADEAGGRDLVTDIGEELADIVNLTREDAKFKEFLSSIILPVKARAASLRRIFESRASDLTLRFLLVLNRKGRLNHLPSIERAYRQLREELFGYIAVGVTTSTSLDAEQVAQITNRLRNALGKEPVISIAVDPELIGGMTLQIGDKFIDASVQARLRRLADRLKTTGAQTIRDRADDLIESTG
ncbi:MAG: ATP synthase F1 subunit delta [Phycisphaerales bacterium]|nr:ATP synthase F1 subunit delta [Phycisphaerales bacterium]